MNSRYLDKRHLYLAAIANHLVRGQAASAAAASAAAAPAQNNPTKKGAKKSDGGAAAAPSSRLPCPLLRGGLDGVRLTAPRGGDARKCSLLLRPSGAAGRRFVVRLGVGLRPGSLLASRLLPGRSNLRRFWAVDPAVPAAARAQLAAQAAAAAEARAASGGTGGGGQQAKAAAEDASLGMPATPHYNALVLH